jgi:hypothetical protein
MLRQEVMRHKVCIVGCLQANLNRRQVYGYEPLSYAFISLLQ